MESRREWPTPREAAATLAEVEQGRASLAASVALPRFFLVTIGVAVAAQIGTTAAGVAGATASPGWLLVTGNAAFVVVSMLLLARFRRLNGLWLAGLVSRVVGGTATVATASYVVALGAATWAAMGQASWLVVPCAVAGGTAYAVSGAAWMRTYRSEPAVHSRGEPVAWLAFTVALSLVGLALLVVLR